MLARALAQLGRLTDAATEAVEKLVFSPEIAPPATPARPDCLLVTTEDFVLERYSSRPFREAEDRDQADLLVRALHMEACKYFGVTLKESTITQILAKHEKLTFFGWKQWAKYKLDRELWQEKDWDEVAAEYEASKPKKHILATPGGLLRRRCQERDFCQRL